MTNHHVTCRIEWADGHQPDDPADDCQECLDAPRGICSDCAYDAAEDGGCGRGAGEMGGVVSCQFCPFMACARCGFQGRPTDQKREEESPWRESSLD